MRTQTVLLAAVLCACPALAQYSYYYSDSFTSIDTTKWWNNPICNNSSSTLAGSGSGLIGAGALLSKLAIPDSTFDSEVKITISDFNPYQGTVIYLRASSDANLCAGVGTFYAVLITRWNQYYYLRLSPGLTQTVKSVSTVR